MHANSFVVEKATGNAMQLGTDMPSSTVLAEEQLRQH